MQAIAQPAIWEINHRGEFTVNDPDEEFGGELRIEPELMVASVAAAQTETDNYVWLIHGSKPE